MKEYDKKTAAATLGKTFRAITFDLEAILPVPFAGDSQIYYKSHLNVYNFTIYDGSTRDGYCYVWDETYGSKGSSEIGSCLLKYLLDLPKTVSHVASFSDTCGGQNRISDKKKEDLVYLLNKKIIPEEYRDFINSLPSTSDSTQLAVHKEID
ncbi:unnamed protein product [Diabrotica balteata]|uniref:Uncharacterized protein n=1 Tax=Diabrotica balteata TaxID=107213 RepID=A0A9N9T682_DIABA|nr:unnamed protein product [Diabrotica balteata]